MVGEHAALATEGAWALAALLVALAEAWEEALVVALQEALVLGGTSF